MLQHGGVYPMLGPGPGPAAVRRLLRRPRGPRRPARPGGPGRGGPHPVAAAVGRRAAAPVAGPGPGGPARGGLPRRAHRRGRPRGPHRRARDSSPTCGTGGSAWCSPPTSWPRPSGWPTTWSSSTRAACWPRARRPSWRRARRTAPSGSPPVRASTPPPWPRPSARARVVDEERPGAYRLLPRPAPPRPAVVAALAGWLAERDLSLGDLRTGQSLEEVYLAITGARPRPSRAPPPTPNPGRRGRPVGDGDDGPGATGADR